MPSIFAISEIAIEIGFYIELDSLFNCVLVSKLWFEAFTPLLWNSFSYSSQSSNSKKEYEKPCITKDTAIKYSQLIHKVTSDDMLLLKTLLPHCNQLRYIDITNFLQPIYLNTSSPYIPLDFFNEILLNTIIRNPNIETFKYNGVPSAICISTPSLFRELLLPLKSLTDLQLHFKTSIILDVFLFLAKFSKQLHRLCISFQDRVPYNIISARTRQRIPEMLETTQLRELVLDFAANSREDILLIPLLKVSPNLESLKFPSFDQLATKTIVQTIQQYCPKLRDIDMDASMENLHEIPLSEIIRSCQTSGLRSIRYSTCRSLFSSKPMVAIRSYSVTLESLSMPLLTSFVPVFLTSCPNLRVFETFPIVDHYDNFNQYCDAGDLLKTPWVCTKLEILKIRIAWFVGSGAPSNIDYHSNLYHQLSELKELQVIDLRNDSWTGKNEVTFSLEGGMRKLSGLKKLRVLGVIQRSCKIKKEELDWMNEHWPNLQRIEGFAISPEAYWHGMEQESGETMTLPIQVSRLLSKEAT